MPKVSDLFNVRYGHSLELNRLRLTKPDNGIAFISRKMGDNGVSAFVEPIEGESPAPAGELSVALGSNGVLSTFLQERPFYTGRDVAIMSPLSSMSKAVLLYYCMCIKANRYRYSWGRQANRSLKDIQIPDTASIPGWVNDVSVDMFAGKDAPARNALPLPIDTEDWGWFQLSFLFDFKKGKRLTKANMRKGVTPFIGAIDNNNGLTCFVEQEALHPGNTITVNYNGNGVAEAFYQPVPFRCSDDVNVLYPKFALNPAIAHFVTALIRLEKYRFSYGRKWHLQRMASSRIRLPVKKDDKPDWEYMSQFIRALPYSSQLDG